MHIPLTPPEPHEVLARTPAEEIPRLFAGIGEISPLVDGRYLHWDDLRHRPPPDGFTHDGWWLRLKLTRQGGYKTLPLLDKHRRPFVIGTPEPLQRDLHHIDRDAAGSIGTPGIVDSNERDRYLLRSLIDEAITSSQLEGASTTRRVAERMLREQRRPRDASERMIWNNYRAMETVRGWRGAPLTPERILELHRQVCDDTLDDAGEIGALRTSDDVCVRDRRDQTLLHQPPAASELPERLRRLCAFANANADATPFVHPVLRAILLHFMIGYDHPFADGNGRTARALFYWAMAQNGYWLTEFISISPFLYRAPGQYARAYLLAETDGNDTTYFALHQLAVIRKAIAALHEHLARQTRERQQTTRLIAQSRHLRSRLNHRQIALLSHALHRPGEEYRIDGHQATHGVVYQTARTDLLALENLGLLQRVQVGKTYYFSAPADLAARLAQLDRNGVEK